MTDGENLLASVQDRVSLVFLVRTLQLLRASHGYGVIALRAATASHGVDDIVISVFEEQFRTFGCRAFVHFPAIVEQCLAVRAHFMDDDGASAQLASSDVGLPVFVP